ncbi:MAG: sugar ABC transporter substrate-binding protein [Chloroflexota bacterium]
MSNTKRFAALSGVALAVAMVAGPAIAQSPAAGPIKLGFVTHVKGNPFIQQIIDGANFAAKDLGVDLQVVGPDGGDPNEQMALIQGLADAGVQGIATSVPGSTLADPINAIIDSGIPVVQFNLLDKGVKAPYVGEKSTESGRILGRAIVDKLGGKDTAAGKVAVGNCFPGFPVLENRQAGVLEALKEAPGITVVGPQDVKATVTDNYAAWEAILTANPDIKAMIGLCAFDVNSLGQLQAANPDTPFVSGGYDLTAENLQQLNDGTAYISLGQSPFMQGYLPIKMLYDTITGATSVDLSQGGFVNAGTEIVTKDSVTEPYDLPALSFADLQAIAADPAKAREYYQPLVDGVIAKWADNLAPIASESE